MEKKIIIVVSAIIIFCATYAVSPVRAVSQIETRQAQVVRELGAKQKDLQQLQQKEKRISDELTQLKKNKKINTSKQKELERSLVKTQALSKEVRRKYDSLVRSKQLMEGDISGTFKLYVFRKLTASNFYDAKQMSWDLLIKYSLFRKYIFLNKLKGESSLYDIQLKGKQKEIKKLEANRSELQKKEKERKIEENNKNKELLNTHKKKEVLLREIKELQKSTRELKALLEKAAKKNQTSSAWKSKKAANRVLKDIVLPIKKHSLPWPAGGTVLHKYGKETNKIVNYTYIREGIVIGVQQGTKVRAVKDGKVTYVGEMRSYGEIVIIQHGEFFTIYGYLSQASVRLNDSVRAGDIIGDSGYEIGIGLEGGGPPAVYFAIGTPERFVDPEIWLK